LSHSEKIKSDQDIASMPQSSSVHYTSHTVKEASEDAYSSDREDYSEEKESEIPTESSAK
jgi:hypothetical protein